MQTFLANIQPDAVLHRLIQATVEAIIASGALVAIFRSLSRYIPALLAGRKRRTMVSSIERIHHTRSIMDEIIDEGEAQRVMLLAAHNSGGIPRIGSPFYASCIHGAVIKEREDNLPVYKNVSVDLAYIQMLLNLLRDGHYHFVVEENQNTMLGSFYQSEGVKDSVLTFLGTEDNQILYVSFAHFERKFTAEERTRLILRGYEIKEALFGG